MTARNDITGDAIMTKSASDAYRDNYDAIFGKKKEEKKMTVKEALAKVAEDISMMSEKDFEDALTEASFGDLAVALRETSEFLATRTRYFTHVDGFKDTTSHIELHPDGVAYIISKDKTKEPVRSYYWVEETIMEEVRQGVWKEIVVSE